MLWRSQAQWKKSWRQHAASDSAAVKTQQDGQVRCSMWPRSQLFDNGGVGDCAAALLDVVEVASVVEEELEAACCRHR